MTERKNKFRLPKLDSPNLKKQAEDNKETETKLKSEIITQNEEETKTGTVNAVEENKPKAAEDDFALNTNQQVPIVLQGFNQAVKKQSGFRIREEFLEALKIEAKLNQTKGELILDELLTEHFTNTPDGRKCLEKAKAVIRINSEY